MTFQSLAHRFGLALSLAYRLRRSNPASLFFRFNRKMSAVAKLQSPLKELVASATQDGSSEFGKNEKDKAEVNEWIEKVAVGEVAKPGKLKVCLIVLCGFD